MNDSGSKIKISKCNILELRNLMAVAVLIDECALRHKESRSQCRRPERERNSA